MKILSIIDSVCAYGKERANFEVDHILQENGATVKILFNSVADKSIREELVGYEFYKIPFPRNLGGKRHWFKYVYTFFFTQVLVIRILIKEKPDYILLPTEIALTYLYFPLLFTKAKKVFRCGDSPLVFRKKGVIANVYGYLWKRFIINHIDVVVSNAKFIQNQISESGRKKCEQDTLIYNYPPVRAVRSDDAVYNHHSNTLRIGFMGRLVEDKGVRELINAVNQLNADRENVIIYICGDTSVDEKYTNELYKIANKSTEFVGLVKDLDKFYENVDVVTVPSIYAEPMANVVAEAKFHTKPVIIFNIGGMPEIVEHKKTGYICPEVSVESLAEGIKFYLDNPELIKEHGENAYRSIVELGLTKEVFTKKWLNVFK